MKARSCYGSKRILLILTLLIGVLSVSAITFGDSIFAPLGFAREASSLAKLDSEIQAVRKPMRLRPGRLPGLTSPSMFAFTTTIDDQGPDDEPGQKDLNSMSIDFGAPGDDIFLVQWQWDNTATTGNNTRDAGALFDTDGDGNANYSLYITVNTDGTFVTQVFICTADSRADRCGGPDEDTDGFLSTANILTNGTDPFKAVASHRSGNTCITRPGCYDFDTVADVTANLNDFGDPANIVLLNVCSYPSGEPNSDPSDCVVEQAPASLTLIKVVDNLGYTYPELAEVSDFALSIDNNATTSGTQVTGLAPGIHSIAEVPVTSPFGYDVGTWECSNEQSGTLGDATFDVDLAAGEIVTCTITNTLQNDALNPHLTVTKTDDGDIYDSVGDVIDYTIVATNDGNVTLASVTVTDPNAANLVCTPANGSSLAPGASMTCTASHTVTQADLDAGHYLNAACADDGAGGAAQACDDVDTPGDQNPALTIEKTSSTQNYDSVGDVITYSITATNSGNVTLASVTITDTEAVLGTCTPANGSSLAPGASITCSATHTATQADIDAGTYNNTACVDDGAGGADQACDDVDVPAVQTPSLSIVKDDNDASYDAVGDVITYSITATNTGNVTLAAVTITDSLATLGTCTPANGSSLAPGATLTCSATHSVTQADLDAGSYLNTACVDDGAGGAAQKCDDEDTPGFGTPVLSIVKGDGDATYDSVGDVITYSIVATNIGNVTIAAVTITDANAVLGTCTPANGSSLAPGASITCSATHVVTQADIDAGSYLNTACVDDGAGGAAQVCDDEGTPAVQNPAITIVKSSSTTLITEVGQVVSYTYVVTNAGNVTLTGIAVTDDKVASVSCPQTALAVGASMTCTGSHTVTAEEFGGSNLTNIAEACGNSPLAVRVCDDDTVTIPVQPPLKGHIMHTGVTCSDFVSENPSDELESGEYSTKSGKVSQVNPGVMFYYSKITAPSADFQINVIQQNDAGWTPIPVQSTGQIILYEANCTKSSIGRSTYSGGTATINVTGATPGGAYVVGIKYSLSGLVGNTVSPPAEIAKYDFSMLFGITPVGGSADSISFFPKP